MDRCQLPPVHPYFGLTGLSRLHEHLTLSGLKRLERSSGFYREARVVLHALYRS
jgi:hypothetical protein